jgi:TRAP-type C4-dicarboxylate transport system substrate-binding protein
VFQQASTEGAAYFNQLIVDDESKSVETALANGGKLLKPEVFDEWQKGAQGVWADFAPIVGGIDRIKAVQTA